MRSKSMRMVFVASIISEERLCTVCGVLSDERHGIYECSLIIRDGIVLNEHIHGIWYQPDIFMLFERFRAAKFL